MTFLQFNVFPWFFPVQGYIDILTPLITAYAVTQKYSRSIFLGIIAGISLETHMTIPAGTLISVYLVIINVLTIVRDLISWRQFTAWIAVSLAAIMWAFLFESFVGWIASNGENFHPLTILATFTSRILSGLVFSLWLSSKITLPEISAPEER